MKTTDYHAPINWNTSLSFFPTKEKRGNRVFWSMGIREDCNSYVKMSEDDLHWALKIIALGKKGKLLVKEAMG